jgi:hypothetical protein
MMNELSTLRVGDVVALLAQASASEDGIYVVERAGTKKHRPRLRRYNPVDAAAVLCRELGWQHHADQLIERHEVGRVWGIAVAEFDQCFHNHGEHGRRSKRRLLARLLGALRRARPQIHQAKHVFQTDVPLDVN